jgi:hypothetical protein
MGNQEEFHWLSQPKASAFIAHQMENCLGKNSFLRHLKESLYDHTSTRLIDWVDHIELGLSTSMYEQLETLGFTPQLATPTYRVFAHPKAKLPFMVLRDHSHSQVHVAISVDSISDFLMVQGRFGVIEGAPLSQFRRHVISKEQGVFVSIVERRGVFSMEPTAYPLEDAYTLLLAYERWQTRLRDVDHEPEEEKAFHEALNIAEEMVEALGTGMAACIVLDIERRYWQLKNRAGQIQKNRQDRLGMGWANHDHHTFRSSRHNFRHLVRLFEILGFTPRERFYAGKEAGWGAQVMENFQARLVLFLDVDLAPHEVEIDFAHTPLEDRQELGTIGLWCALHGESILKAGMHHLEAQFEFAKLEQDLTHFGVQMMAPFTDLAYLKQAFTKGELWAVSKSRIERLLKKKQITEQEAERFLREGALGSHLENLERQEGFKGFSQKGVNRIIEATNPRTL